MDGDRFRLDHDRIEWKLVDDEIVAVDLAESEYFAVTGAGAVMWPAIADGTTRAALVELVLEEFDVDAGQAGADVDVFLADLERRGMVRPT